VTIRKGEPWGSVGPLPPATVRVRSDAEVRGVIAAARAAGTAPPPVALLGGSLMRAVGGTGDERRLDGEVAILPVDVVRVELDDLRTWCVAHVVARRTWWRGELVAVMNAEFLGSWDVAPRGHPNDGRVDVVEVDATMSVRDRWRARGRLPSGTHVPHPAIRVRQRDTFERSFDRPMSIRVDGVDAGVSRRLRCVVEPDALVVCV
jgi:hypothetical protein